MNARQTSDRPLAKPRKALILAGERLMVPLLADVLRLAGLSRVVSYRHASLSTLRRSKPDVVLLDADRCMGAPFDFIRRLHAQTEARIVVLTRGGDPLWNAMAYSLGADAILGPNADRQDLVTTVAGLLC